MSTNRVDTDDGCENCMQYQTVDSVVDFQKVGDFVVDSMNGVWMAIMDNTKSKWKWKWKWDLDVNSRAQHVESHRLVEWDNSSEPSSHETFGFSKRRRLPCIILSQASNIVWCYSFRDLFARMSVCHSRFTTSYSGSTSVELCKQFLERRTKQSDKESCINQVRYAKKKKCSL